MEDERLAQTAPLGLAGSWREQVQRYDERAAGERDGAGVRGPQREDQRRAPHQTEQRSEPREVFERRSVNIDVCLRTILCTVKNNRFSFY